MAKRHLLIGFVAACAILAANYVLAEVPRKDPAPGDTLQAVLDRIRNHASDDTWKEPGWKDEAIEAWLDKLIGSVAKAAEMPDLKLPVRMAGLTAGDQPMARLLSGALIVGKDVDLKTRLTQNCMIFADGNIEVQGADGCVLVSRGTITVHGISQRSVLVAGTLAKLRMDGRPGTNDAGSLIVSRGWVDVGSSVYGTIFAAHEGINAGRFQGAVFVNAAVPLARFVDPRGGNGSRSITVNDLPLEHLPVHRLSEKITLLGILHGEREEGPRFGGLPGRMGCGPTGIVFRFDGRKYVAEIGQAIVDEAGNPVPSLRAWKVIQVRESLAILSGADADMIVRKDDK